MESRVGRCFVERDKLIVERAECGRQVGEHLIAQARGVHRSGEALELVAAGDPVGAEGGEAIRRGNHRCTPPGSALVVAAENGFARVLDAHVPASLTGQMIEMRADAGQRAEEGVAVAVRP